MADAQSVSPSIAPSIAPSVATKATHFSNASKSTIRTTSTTRSSSSNKKKKNQTTDWRVITRDIFATTFDIIGDWAYFHSIYNHDFESEDAAQQYNYYDEQQQEEDAEVQEQDDVYAVNEVGEMLASVDTRSIVHLAFAFCLMGAVFYTWTFLTAFKRKFGGNSIGCNCTIPRIALASIFFQDIPQIVFTFYFDRRYFGQVLTSVGVLNVCSSVNAIVNKATTHYEELAAEEEDKFVIITNYEAMPEV
mmetsp:Transcript_439/g.876  ORF Transcript_439/g.876 Transcript_439/m.876 type:complete len:248 (-) Transcript_439:158-901(-)